MRILNKRYAVDRIVDGIAVLIPDADGETLHLDAKKYDLSANDIVDISENGDKSLNVTKNDEEKKLRQQRARAKLNSLFGKSKRS